MNVLSFFVNNKLVYEFDRVISFDEQQLAFLKRMDIDMDGGIMIRGQLHADPDKEQRATFVVMNLINALKQGDEAKIKSACAYLISRNPALIEVHVNDHENTVKIELIEAQD